MEEKIKLLFQGLGEKLGKEAEQHTKKEISRKGYDTDGYGYQFCVNQFNALLGDQWGFTWAILKEVQGAYKSGSPFWEITVEVKIWVLNPALPRSCVGGHIGSTYFDTLKGAITNGFKKAAAFWGVGRQAYEGTMDDDNTPYPDSSEKTTEKTTEKKQEQKKQTTPTQTDLKKGGATKGNENTGRAGVLFVMFNKLGLKTCTQYEYKLYVYHKYAVTSMAQLKPEHITEQKGILQDLGKNPKNKAAFEKHLATLKGAGETPQNEAGEIRNRVRHIMQEIYGQDQQTIDFEIGKMTVDGSYDLALMELDELKVVQDCAELIFEDYKTGLK